MGSDSLLIESAFSCDKFVDSSDSLSRDTVEDGSSEIKSLVSPAHPVIESIKVLLKRIHIIFLMFLFLTITIRGRASPLLKILSLLSDLSQHTPSESCSRHCSYAGPSCTHRHNPPGHDRERRSDRSCKYQRLHNHRCKLAIRSCPAACQI